MRLRLRRIWAMLAILLCIAGVFSFKGKIQKEIYATDTTTSDESTEEPTTDTASGQYKMWFLTTGGGDIGFQDTDGTSKLQWNMKTAETNTFVIPNTATVTARISIDGEVAADLTDIVEHIKWTYAISGADGEEDQIVSIEPAKMNSGLTQTGSQQYEGDGEATELQLLISPKTAGLVEIHFTIIGTRDNKEVITISRSIVIGSPLQIYSFPTDDSIARNYSDFAKDDSDDILEKKSIIYANNAANVDQCKIYWFYADADGIYQETSPVWIQLEDLSHVPDIPDEKLTSTSRIISEIEKGSSSVKNGVNVYSYTLKRQETGGFTRIVGRIYLGGDSRASQYVECEYDVVNAARFNTGQLKEDPNNDNQKTLLELDYGDRMSFSALSNDSNNSLGWISYSDWKDYWYGTPEDKIVVIDSQGITAQNFGMVTLQASSLLEGWEEFNAVVEGVSDRIHVRVNPDILKGTSSKEIIDYASETITINGTIQLSTNIEGSEYSYRWSYLNGVEWEQITTTNGNPEEFSVSGTSDTNGYSAITLTGKKSGKVTMKCEVAKGSVTVFEKEFVIKVIDTMTLSETRKTVVEGGSFEIQAFVSGASVGNPVIWQVEEGYEDYVAIESTGRTTAMVSGLANTAYHPVHCTAAYEINGTTVSADFYVTVVPVISDAHIEATPSSIISVGDSATLHFISNTEGIQFNEGQIKWILKDVNGQGLAEQIIEKTDDPNDILKSEVKGLQVGKAYVAVVMNDEAQTEIAITTIEVVPKVTRLALNEHEVTDYLPGSYTLTATLQPEDSTNNNVEIQWSTTNENIATVTPDPEDSRKAVVKYLAVGTVRITASVSGFPDMADFCTFVLERAAEGITLDKEVVYLKVGETVSVTPTLTPENVTNPTVTWLSQDEKIATVSQTGVITAVSPGTTFVKCASSNESLTPARVKVIVTNPEEKEAIRLEIASYPKINIYEIGDDFSSKGLKVNVIYRNGEKRELMEEEYTIDFSAFHKNRVGKYKIKIHALINEQSLETDFTVTVRPSRDDDDDDDDDEDDDDNEDDDDDEENHRSNFAYENRDTLTDIENRRVSEAVNRILGTSVDVKKVEKAEQGIFITSKDNEILFTKTDGTLAQNEWQWSGREWYYFDADYRAATGWKQLNTRWYYFDNTSRKMETGWMKSPFSGLWYYMDPKNGNMETGWKEVNHQWYYMDPTNGDMKTGWQQIHGKWYFMDQKNGNCLINTVTPDGYKVDENGAWIP